MVQDFFAQLQIFTVNFGIAAFSSSSFVFGIVFFFFLFLELFDGD